MDLQKRKKNYYSGYHNHQKKRKQYNLEPGIRGFFCTCNFREKDCVREVYSVLSEYADNLYGTEKTELPTRASNETVSTVQSETENCHEKASEEEQDSVDISEALKKEIAELKAESQKPVNLRRFQVVDTGVKSVVFIRTTIPNPLELVSTIIKELYETKKQRTRYLMRLLPVEVVCKAYMDDIKLKANTLFEKYFAQEPKTFAIIFNRHSNNSIKRGELIEDLADIIAKKNPGNKADLKNPELAVVVEVIRGVCLLSIAPSYYKYKKYNLLEICGVRETDKKDSANAASPEPMHSKPEEESTETDESKSDKQVELPVDV
ncbi:THUMP domain-containing protein 1 homolog [Diprion similis]|uniref:THUMP domain-containing protein 1 homolog n=1 Tax=Diprion similis TaxID=362088 RepID=UPI001EF90745|nr:THUMP domain-containing protein 1 homolog [Diprion similis]